MPKRKERFTKLNKKMELQDMTRTKRNVSWQGWAGEPLLTHANFSFLSNVITHFFLFTTVGAMMIITTHTHSGNEAEHR